MFSIALQDFFLRTRTHYDNTSFTLFIKKIETNHHSIWIKNINNKHKKYLN